MTSSESPEVCPGCGAKWVEKFGDKTIRFSCDSVIYSNDFKQSSQCKDRQTTQRFQALQDENVELKELLEKARIIITSAFDARLLKSFTDCECADCDVARVAQSLLARIGEKVG